MKAINIITHPYLLIISFLLLLISGQHFGGFYMLYLLMALPHGGIHALFAVAGIAILIVGQIILKPGRKHQVEPVLNIVGVICLLVSIVLFFYNDKQKYNYDTFDQTVPLITLSLFGILSAGFIIRNLVKFPDDKSENGNVSLKRL